jgi:hypothetical protein
MQAVADEPADGDVDLSLAHQLAAVHDANEQSGEHQPNRDLRIDSRPPVVEAIIVGDLFPKSGQVEHAVHACQHMLIRNELLERAGDKELQLISLFAPERASGARGPR